MFHYKKALLIGLIATTAIQLTKTMEDQEKPDFIKAKLAEIFNEETDNSVVIQECKRVLLDDNEENATLITACSHLAVVTRGIKNGDLIFYKKYLAKLAKEQKCTKLYIHGHVHEEINKAFKASKKTIKNARDAQLARESFYQFLNDIESDQELLGIIKQFSQDSEFTQPKFLVKTICEELGKPEISHAEKEKIIGVLKQQYDKK